MKHLFMCIIFIYLLFSFSSVFAVVQAEHISDREIIESLTELKTGQKALEQRIDGLERSVNQRIDSLQNLMYVIIGAIFAQIVGIVGFVLWDRRTALAPAIHKTNELSNEINELRNKTRELEKKTAHLEELLTGCSSCKPHAAHS